VARLRTEGWSVWDCAAMGGGFPDLCVGKHGKTLLLEVKDGTKPPSARKLTPDEERFFENWRGSAYVVTSPEEAADICRLFLSGPPWRAHAER
jgi:hypothetical protein